MRIAIVGPGGAGGYLGARLAEAGEDVVLVARGEHLEAIRRGGLRLESIDGDVLVHPAAATDDPSEIGTVDAAVVATKSWQLPAAAKAIRPMVGPDTVVVPVLNGVEAPTTLAEVLGKDAVVGGLCGMQAFIAAPGVIRHVGARPWLAFGELDGTVSGRIHRLEEAFGGCRALEVSVPPDIGVAMWEKFIFIASSGGVGAVTRAPYGTLREIPAARALLEAAMHEVWAVGRAHGVDLPDDAVARALALVDGMEPHVTSSMQRDIIAGRRSELEQWNGAVVRLGEEAGVETPVHSFIYAALLPQESRARGTVEFPEAPPG